MIHLTSQNFTPKELIQNVFSPLVGAVCSPFAEEICQKNNLTFVEMLQPFSKLSSEAFFKDSTSGTNVSIKGLRINICDVNWRPPQTIFARKLLNEAVLNIQCDKTKSIKIDEKTSLHIPVAEPWFEHWRETFLTVQFPSDHEFTRHFLGCLIVISSSDLNPVEQANQLTKKIQMSQNVTPPKLPKWFTTDVLNCYVMLHDGCQGDITKAQQAFEFMKSSFGEHRCFLLKVNSQQTNVVDCPDPWLRYLKRHPKVETPNENDSTPKTPQDMISVTSMPTSVQINSLEPNTNKSLNSETVIHPLSPVQDILNDPINSTLSTSTDSLTSQIMNPNVWANEVDVDVPHGMWLSASDVENLRHFVQDFAIRALIPYVEKLVAVLNDSIANKKGVSRSLLSATKRWFVTNKPGTNTTQNAVVYTSESTELQTRKLGDLYFMFRNYNLAFQAYHQAKRDFNADSAWNYFAGALEMAALSAFMQDTANRKTYDYMEEAIVTYLNICKLNQFATRATLLSMECLKTVKLFGESAKQLIRMTSEDSDLRSALLLEQASYCFLHSQPPLFRKYAFHSVLAGHRYSKSGQRKHAFRCYKQAYQVFESKGWSLAEDHIQYTIGKQAVTLKKLDVASKSLAHLLRPSSLQCSTQQAAFLREYIATQKALLLQNENIGLLNLSLPRVIQNMTRLLVTSLPPVTNPLYVTATNISVNSNLVDDWKWNKLEELIVQVAFKKPVMIFKPLKSLFTYDMLANDRPLGIQGEPIEIRFSLQNSIKPVIIFEDIQLLWEFERDNGTVLTNKNLFKTEIALDEKKHLDSIITSTSIKAIEFNEYETKIVVIKLTPHFIGFLKIVGIVGKISALNDTQKLWGKIDIDPIDIDNKETTVQIHDKNEANKSMLNIEILPPAPALQIQFSQIPNDILSGEIIPININMTNSGSSVITDVYISCENPRWLLINSDTSDLPLSIMKDYKDLTNDTFNREKETRKQHVFKILNANDNLLPNKTIQKTIWLQSPFKKGITDLKILIYYTMPEDYPKLKYRLIRHVWSFNVNESISVECNCHIINENTNNLGIDISIKNLNEIHHPLMTEILPYNLYLLCPNFKYSADNVFYLNSPGYNRIFKEDAGLKSSESISLKCLLDEKQEREIKGSNKTPAEFINNRLSKIEIKKLQTNNKNNLPSISNIDSFLMKYETKFVGSLANNEEFNNIVTNPDMHMTIVVLWRAIVNDNDSNERIAYGKHFVSLRNLFEPIYLPHKERLYQTSFGVHEQLYGIYDFINKVPTKIIDEEVDDWENNNNYISSRCYIDDENYENV